MKPPRGGLRPIHNKGHDVAKVELRIPAGATIEAQDDVAAQLLGTGDFAEGAAPAALLDALDAGHEARFPEPDEWLIDGADEPTPTDETPVEAAPVPVKKPAKKTTPRKR